MRAWQVHEFGEPLDALRLDDVPPPTAGPGEILVRVAATTLNFNDVDGVRGRYRTVAPPLPYTPGMEVLGVVEGAGSGAEEWIGKRVVAIPGGAFGGYAELAVGPSAMAFEMPPVSEIGRHPGSRRLFPVPSVVAGPARTGPDSGGRNRSHSRRRGWGRLRGHPTRPRRRRPGHCHSRICRQTRSVSVLGCVGCDRLQRE